MLLRRLSILSVAAVIACGPRGPAAPGDPEASPPVLAEELARLTIPPGPETAGALERLARRAGGGEIEAAWGRAHYLVDLFDDARFRAAGDSLPVLGGALGAPGLGRGAGATDRAVAALTVEVDRVLELQRLHPGAQAARTLLELDARPARARAEVFQRMIELKTVARGGGPMGANAKLRLFGHCRQAFEDAVRVAPRHRMRILAHCLYPLYDSDPDPYFDSDPRKRPPPPRWQALAEEARALLAGVDETERLARAASAQRRALSEFLEERQSALPDVADPASLSLPSAHGAVPFDWTPILDLGDGAELKEKEAYVEAMRPLVSADDRAALALSMAAHAGAGALRTAAEVATDAGASRLGLLVTTQQELVVPPGDYWATRLDSDRVARLATLSLSLAPLGAAEPPEGDLPRAAAWDPRRAALRLHLVVERGRWRLFAPTGRLGEFESGADGSDPVAALRAALARVRAAFPEEDGLILVPGADASYAAVVAAASAAARDANGRPAMSRLALALDPPKPGRGDLARRIERRAGATVEIVPESLQRRQAVVRGCYLESVEASPRLAGTIELELEGGDAVVVGGPRHRRLRACVLDAIGDAMKSSGTASVKVHLSPAK